MAKLAASARNALSRASQAWAAPFCGLPQFWLMLKINLASFLQSACEPIKGPLMPLGTENKIAVFVDGANLYSTAKALDLVVYALVDSLILHSGYANIRLESYLFTEQAFDDVRRVLKPDGIFVMYNFYRQGWIVQRVATMAKRAFGCDPIVLPLPYTDTIKSSEQAGFTTIIAGCNPRILTAFQQHGKFWLNRLPSENLLADGFATPIGSMPS
jgi:SAM-dependent methyltransferase